MKGGWRYSDPRKPYAGLGLYPVDDFVREPLYHSSQAAYVMELTIPVCIIAVETAADIRPDTCFFTSRANAQKSIESRLGPVSCWEKFFSVGYAGRGDLFEGLSIWQEEKFRKLQGTYPVIALSFADVKETTFRGARKRISQIIAELYNRFDFWQTATA